MIEIIKTNTRREGKSRVKTKKNLSTQAVRETGFTDELQKTISIETDRAIEDLLSDLKDQEKRFLDSQSYYEMNKYKIIVQKILKTVMDQSCKTVTLKRTRRDRADFTIVEKINQKMAIITSEITRSNKAFNLMKAIEEIRGLIFDLAF